MYDVEQAITFLNGKYSSLLPTLTSDKIEHIECDLLSGRKLSDLLPLTANSTLQNILLLSLALDSYFENKNLIHHAAQIAYQHSNGDVEFDCDVARSNLKSFLDLSGQTLSDVTDKALRN